MARVVPLTEIKRADVWREVKDQEAEEFWGELKEETLDSAKCLIESHLEEELVHRLRASLYPDYIGVTLIGVAGATDTTHASCS